METGQTTYYTQERLCAHLDYYRAQEIAKELLAEGLISPAEFDKLSDINLASFSPLLSEIRPKGLAIPGV